MYLLYSTFSPANPSTSFHPFFPWWPCLNLCHNILSFAMNSGLAWVFSVQNLIITPIADARLPLDGTYRKCCDRGPMTGKEIKLVCEYVNVFPSIKTLSAELKILLFWRKLDPIDFSLCDLGQQWECLNLFADLSESTLSSWQWWFNLMELKIRNESD